jgi:hypothetical protein
MELALAGAGSQTKVTRATEFALSSSEKKGVKKMKHIQSCLSLLLLAEVMGYTPIAVSAEAPNQPKGVKPGVIGAVALNRDGTYCHLRFPAIQGRTLGTDKPRLKPATTKDIIDYYGACDHDPVGKEEVESQKQLQEERKYEAD